MLNESVDQKRGDTRMSPRPKSISRTTRAMPSNALLMDGDNHDKLGTQADVLAVVL